MALHLVLFIDDEETYSSYPLPQDNRQWVEFYEEAESPESVYREMYGFGKSENPDRETPDFKHEYKILWREE